jgi:hypothetical protein
LSNRERRRCNAVAINQVGHMATSTQKWATAIVLYLRRPFMGIYRQVLTCLKSCSKTGTYRSLRSSNWQPWCPSAGTSSDIDAGSYRIAGATGVRIVHVRAPVARRLWHRTHQSLDRTGRSRKRSSASPSLVYFFSYLVIRAMSAQFLFGLRRRARTAHNFRLCFASSLTPRRSVETAFSTGDV